MRHMWAIPSVQPAPGKQEISKPSSRLRAIFRQSSILACLVLFAVSLLGFILKSTYMSHGLVPTIQEFTGPAIFNKSDAFKGSLPTQPTGLDFMEAKNVVLVSHELSLSGSPLLLMELAVLLKKNRAHVHWVTGNQKETVTDPVVRALEDKLVNQGVQILAARGPATVRALYTADLVVLNTAVAGKWIDTVVKENVLKVLTKVVWWIHEVRGHYFALDYVKHLPNVAAVMIDSHATAEYWRLRTKDLLRMTVPKIYVVHLGNSNELMAASEDSVSRALMRQHVRQTLGLHNDDVVFAMINSVSRGKGQDLFLRAFAEAVNLVRDTTAVQPAVPQIHALLVGSDWSALKYETKLRKYVTENDMGRLVHFINRSMNVVPYLATSDVLVQNSQGRGECFGRITIEGMAFQLPVLGTAAGGTSEIVLDGRTGRLHPVGKGGVQILAHNIRDLAFQKSLRIKMGNCGYQRVRNTFMEHHMCERLGHIFRAIISQT